MRKFVILTALVAVAVLLSPACQKNRAPEKPAIAGPASGACGDTLTFTVSASDPDKDEVSYSAEWGDGSTTEWTQQSHGSAAVDLQHVYADRGAFQCKVRAKDPRGLESEYSDPHDILIVTQAEADQSGIKALVQGDAFWFGSSTKSDSGESTLVVLNDTTVLNWWRGGPTTFDQPVITVGVSGDSAYVEWKRHHTGWFYQWYDPGNGQPRGSWSKRLGDTTRINAVFLRRGKVSDTNRGWRLNRVSILTGESDSTRSVAIDSLRIQSASVGDRVFSGPLGTFWDTTNLVRFTPGEQVTLTLYTCGPVGEAYLHSVFWRWPFTDQGNGVFTGTWNAPWFPGIRLVVFDLLNKNTIRTQAEPYDFHGWLFPYQVESAD